MRRGHAELVARPVDTARRLRLPSVLLTFDLHPAELDRPEARPASLTTLARRAELAAQIGIDHFRGVPFDLDVADLEPVDFVRQELVERFEAAEVFVEANFRFGRRASGSVTDLRELGAQLGFSCIPVELVTDDDVVLSATSIRAAIEVGDVEAARAGLGRPHRIDDVIEHGDHRGCILGFPTANLGVDASVAVPADGVYAGWVVLFDEQDQTSRRIPLQQRRFRWDATLRSTAGNAGSKRMF